MIRVAFYNHTGQVSGAEIMLLIGLSSLPRSMFTPLLVCPAEGPLAAAAMERHISVYPSRAIHARFTWNPLLLARYMASLCGSLWGLRRTIRELAPDVIHANTVRAGITATLATFGIRVPIVLHNHDMLPASHPITLGIRTMIAINKRVRVVACSAAAANTLGPVIKRQAKPTVIYNCCNVARSKLSESRRQETRAEIGAPPGQFVIAIVGQLTRRKGQLEMIRAFAQVRTYIPDAVLVLCGAPLFNNDRKYLETLHQETDRLGLARHVRFLGHRNDAAEVIGAADLYILNSRREPFALTIIEAMAVGTPVVATDCGGPSEAIRHEVDGEIVAVGDENALVKTIVRLAADPVTRRRYAASSALRVKEKFSRERYIRKWCAVYEEICAEAYPAAEPSPPADLPLRSGVTQ